MRHDVQTASGQDVSIITYRNGQREVALYSETDPDEVIGQIVLTRAEATAIADILGISVLVGELDQVSERVQNLYTEEIVLSAASPFAGKLLGDTQARTLTGTSVVGIDRDGTVIPSPTPKTPIEAGDVLVAVGTREALEALARLLATGTI